LEAKEEGFWRFDKGKGNCCLIEEWMVVVSKVWPSLSSILGAPKCHF